MNIQTKEYQSHLKKYLIIWFITIIAIIYMYFTGYLKQTLVIGIAYIIFWVIIYNFESHRFTSYLEKHHVQVLKEKGHVGLAQNIFKWKDFIYSDDNLNDPQLAKIKENFKNIFIFNMLQIFTLPIIVILVNIIGKFIF